MVECNFCASTRQCVEKTNEFYVDMLYIVIPNFNPEEYTNPNICQDCDTLVTDIFNFKTICLEFEDSLYNYKTEGTTEIELEKLVGLATFSKGKLCRACFEEIEDDLYVNFNIGDSLLKQYQRKCLFNLNLFLTKDPVMCMRCANLIEKYYLFVHHFETVKHKNKSKKPLWEIIVNETETQDDSRTSAHLSDNEDNELLEVVKEEISIDEHVLDNPEPTVLYKNYILNEKSGLLEEIEGCDVENDSDNDDRISSNSNNTTEHNHVTVSSNKEVLESIEETSSKIDDVSNKNGSLLLGNENKDKSQNLRLNESATNNNKRKRSPLITISDDGDNDADTIYVIVDDTVNKASSSSGTDTSRSSTPNRKPRKSKRLVRKKRNYDENDSDFNPDIETESDSDYDVDAGKKKPPLFYCKYCSYKDSNSRRVSLHMSTCNSRIVERQLFSLVPPPPQSDKKLPKQAGAGMSVNKKKRSSHPGIIRSNPLLAALLTDSDSDSVDSETECLLKCLLMAHKALPDPRKSVFQGFSKTDQNFIIQKLTMHPALPEPTINILKKIATTKDKRKALLRLKLKRKCKASLASGIQQSDVKNVNVAPGQSNISITNNSQFLPGPSGAVPNQLVIWPQQAPTAESAPNAVPNQQLVMWPQQASNPNVGPNQQLVIWPQGVAPGSAADSTSNVANFQIQTTQTQYYSITSTTNSPNVPVSTNISQTPNVSDNMKNLIMEFLKDKYATQSNMNREVNLHYSTSTASKLPSITASAGTSCIDLTFEDPNDPNQLGAVVEEMILPNVIDDDNFDGAVDVDPLSLDTAASNVTADPIGEDDGVGDVEKTASPGDKTVKETGIPADNDLSSSEPIENPDATATSLVKNTSTKDKIDDNNKDKNDMEIDTVISDLEQVLTASKIDQPKSVQIETTQSSDSDDDDDNDAPDDVLISSDEDNDENRHENQRSMIAVPTDVSRYNYDDNDHILRNLLTDQKKLDDLQQSIKHNVDVSGNIADVTIEIDDDHPNQNHAADTSISTSINTADGIEEINEDQSIRNGPADNISIVTDDVTTKIDDNQQKENRPDSLPSTSIPAADVTMEIDDNQSKENSPDYHLPSRSTATADVTLKIDDNQSKLNHPSTLSATDDVTIEIDDNQSEENRPVDPSLSTSTVTADVIMKIDDNQSKDNHPSTLSATDDVTMEIDDNQSEENRPVDPSLSTSTATADVIRKNDDNQSEENRPVDALPSISTATADVTKDIDDNQSKENRPVDPLSSISTATADVTMNIDDNQSKQNHPLISTATADVTMTIDDNQSKQNHPLTSTATADVAKKIDDKQLEENRQAVPAPLTSTETADVTKQIDENQPKETSTVAADVTKEINDNQSKSTADVTIEIDDDQSSQNSADSLPSTSKATDLPIKKANDKPKRKPRGKLPPISSRTTDVTIELDSDGDISTVKEPIDGVRVLATSRSEMKNRISKFANMSNTETNSDKKVVTMALNNHLSCPFELAIFKCDSCAYNTRFFRLIEEHSLQHFNVFQKSDSYVCMHCSKSFEEKSELSTHLQIEHSQFFYTLWFWCVNCTTPFSRHSDVLKHNKKCPQKNITVNLFKSNHTVFCMICYFETSAVEKARTHTKTCVTRHVKPVEIIELE